MSKVFETTLEIRLNALGHNYRYLSSKLKKDVKFMAVVKAYGYGNDAAEIAKELKRLGVDYFAVAYAKEGIALRDYGIKSSVLVLHPLPVNFEDMIDRCLEPSLYNVEVLNEFIKAAEAKKQIDYPVHIKFNTGLNRLGFWENDVDHIVMKLNESKAIKAKSIFSHLAASEDLLENAFTLNQIETFRGISKNMIESLGYRPMLHMCNTSGILNYPEAHLDMVRSGIGLYGFGNSDKENKNFKPIASLKSIISQIHHIEKGETVGYNRAFKSDPNILEQKIATIPIGHADGISRAYGNEKGWVVINNKKAPIVGNVCMDMIMVNITDIDCSEGDEVLIFGEHPSANELAETIGSIPYELITAVSQRIKRVVYKS